MQNELAKQCNKTGEKIQVKNIDGVWFIIDNSFNLNEAETIGKDALRNNLGVQKYFNEHKETNFEVSPKFILNALGQVTSNQTMFAKNIETHMQVLKDIGNAITDLKKEVQKLNAGERT